VSFKFRFFKTVLAHIFFCLVIGKNQSQGESDGQKHTSGESYALFRTTWCHFFLFFCFLLKCDSDSHVIAFFFSFYRIDAQKIPVFPKSPIHLFGMDEYYNLIHLHPY